MLGICHSLATIIMQTAAQLHAPLGCFVILFSLQSCAIASKSELALEDRHCPNSMTVSKMLLFCTGV